MLVVMGIGLFTSRIVLQALGVEDYGIYNLVGGLVVMFTLINSAMLSATQRFINFGLGLNKIEKLRIIFKTSCIIHIILAGIVLLIAETFGIWLLTYKLQIPVEKTEVTMLVFQMSILTVVLQIITLPYNAVVVAHEKMSVFATISIVQSLLSFGVASVLLTLDNNRLNTYAILTCVIQSFIAVFYVFYCRANFEESKGQVSFDRATFKEMISFAGWCTVGCTAGMMYTQGLNVLLGIFFPPVINAARGLSIVVQSAVNQVFNNAQTAVVPQLIQSYARNDIEYFFLLIFKSSKYFSFLLILVAIPVWIRTPYLLELWLGEYPDYTVEFIRILLCVSLIEAISGPLMRASDATGDIKKYHIVVGGVLMTIVPIAYLLLKKGLGPQSVFYTYLCISFIALFVRLIILKQKINLSIKVFFTNVLIPITGVLFITFLASYYVSNMIRTNLVGMIEFTMFTTIISILTIYICGMSKKERKFINNKILHTLRITV